MFLQFLNTLHCIDPSEEYDWKEICRMIREDQDPMFGFQPAIRMDTEPLRVLETTDAVKYREHSGNSIWIVPFGAHDGFGIPYLREVIRDFYETDSYPESFDTSGCEFEEMICLEQEDYSPVTCVHFTAADHSILWFINEQKPEDAWKDIVERYGIKIHVLADSGKGMGDWFENVPLYDCIMCHTDAESIPKYYLKGLYISNDLPVQYEEAASYAQLRGDMTTVIGVRKA